MYVCECMLSIPDTASYDRGYHMTLLDRVVQGHPLAVQLGSGEEARSNHNEQQHGGVCDVILVEGETQLQVLQQYDYDIVHIIRTCNCLQTCYSVTQITSSQAEIQNSMHNSMAACGQQSFLKTMQEIAYKSSALDACTHSCIVKTQASMQVVEGKLKVRHASVTSLLCTGSEQSTATEMITQQICLRYILMGS